jgi:hypothetical protein
MVSTKSESLNSPNDILPLRAAPSGNLEKLAGLAKVPRCCLIYVSGQGRFHDELTAEVAEVTSEINPPSDVRGSTMAMRLGLTCCMQGLYTVDDDASAVVAELAQSY